MGHEKSNELDEIRIQFENLESMQSKFGIKLSPRTINKLLEMKVTDPVSLAKFDLAELNSVYGAGNKTLGEIKDAQTALIQVGFEPPKTQGKPRKSLSYQALDVLYEIGVEEGDSLEDVSLVDIVAIPGAGPKVIREILAHRERGISNPKDYRLSVAERQQALAAVVVAMNPRASKVVAGLELVDVKEFLEVDWETLLGRKQCGRETFDQIVRMQNLIRNTLRSKPDISLDSLVLKIRNHSVLESKTFY